MKVYCFYIIKSELELSDFPGLLSSYVTDINGKSVGLYAFTPDKEVAKWFRETRSKKLFFEKVIDMNDVEYIDFSEEYDECLLEPHTFNTRIIVNGRYKSITKMLYCTLNESDSIIFYKEECVLGIISDILDDRYFSLMKGLKFKNKLKKILDDFFLYENLISKIAPMEDINYDNFIVDDVGLYIKLFKNTFKTEYGGDKK